MSSPQSNIWRAKVETVLRRVSFRSGIFKRATIPKKVQGNATVNWNERNATKRATIQRPKVCRPRWMLSNKNNQRRFTIKSCKLHTCTRTGCHVKYCTLCPCLVSMNNIVLTGEQTLVSRASSSALMICFTFARCYKLLRRFQSIAKYRRYFLRKETRISRSL